MSMPVHPIFFVAALNLGCGSQPAQTAANAAECASVEAFYTEAASEVLDQGLCDKYLDNPPACPVYVAIEDAYVATREKLQCPLPR